MQAGFQVFDDSGNIIFDLTDRMGRVLGLVRIDAGQSGSIALPDYISGQPFASFQRDSSVISGMTNQFVPAVPVVTVYSNVIVWVSKTQFTTWLGSTVNIQPVGGWLTYGVY
jgi:hypothetical protein